jgi:hypothetical protein
MDQINIRTVYTFAIACILSLCYAVYFPILGHDFINGWDDQWQVINEYTETWSWANVWYILTEYYYGQYSPTNQMLYTILHHFAGYHPAWFHLLCLLLHTGNAILVFVLARQLLQVNLPAGSDGKAITVALGIALLFAVHPLQVESVAWISASKILVYSFFYLWALWCYLCYLQKGKGIRYFAMLLCFVLSFGGKEQAIMLPACLLWIDLVYRRNFRDSKLWYEKMPVFVLTLLFVYTTMESTGHVKTLIEGENYPFMHRLVFTCYAFCEYIVKTFFPAKLLYLYPFPMLAGEPLPPRFWIYPVLLLIVGAAFWKFWKQRPVWLGMSWFLIHIAMLLHIVPLPRLNIVADRYIYLAAPGLFFIVAWYAYVAWEARPQYRRWILAGSVACLLLLGTLAHHRAAVWHDNASLKKDMQELLLQRNPTLNRTVN